MPDHLDNISPLPTAEERLISRIRKAMEDYTMGHSQAIQAVITYGRGLLEGRKLYPSKQAFSRWVTENGFDQDKPWTDRFERAKAMQIAEMIDVGRLPTSAFDACPHDLPTNMMKWYRKMHGEASEGQQAKARKAKAAPKFDAAYEAYAEAMEEGSFTNRDDLARKVGVSNGIMDKAMESWAQANAAEQARVKEEDEWLASSPLSAKGKATLDDRLRIYKERLHKENERTFGERLREGIQKANRATLDQLKEARDKISFLQREQAKASKGAPLTSAEFNKIAKALDPTPFQIRFPDEALVKSHTEAYQIMNEKKLILVRQGK